MWRADELLTVQRRRGPCERRCWRRRLAGRLGRVCQRFERRVAILTTDDDPASYDAPPSSAARTARVNVPNAAAPTSRQRTTSTANTTDVFRPTRSRARRLRYSRRRRLAYHLANVTLLPLRRRAEDRLNRRGLDTSAIRATSVTARCATRTQHRRPRRDDRLWRTRATGLCGANHVTAPRLFQLAHARSYIYTLTSPVTQFTSSNNGGDTDRRRQHTISTSAPTSAAGSGSRTTFRRRVWT